MNHGVKLVSLILFSFLAVSCGSMYESEFACSEYPNMGCTPTEIVFERSENYVHDYRRDRKQSEPSTASANRSGVSNWRDRRNRNKDKAKKGRSSTMASQEIVVAPVARAMEQVEVGKPVLSTPKTMRILFMPWEDKEKDLNIGGYVYVRLGEPEWLILKK